MVSTKCVLTQAHRLGYIVQCKPLLRSWLVHSTSKTGSWLWFFLMFIYCVCVWLGMVVWHGSDMREQPVWLNTSLKVDLSFRFQFADVCLFWAGHWHWRVEGRGNSWTSSQAQRSDLSLLGCRLWYFTSPTAESQENDRNKHICYFKMVKSIVRTPEGKLRNYFPSNHWLPVWPQAYALTLVNSGIPTHVLILPDCHTRLVS